jgi:hypothetical protein
MTKTFLNKKKDTVIIKNGENSPESAVKKKTIKSSK